MMTRRWRVDDQEQVCTRGSVADTDLANDGDAPCAISHRVTTKRSGRALSSSSVPPQALPPRDRHAAAAAAAKATTTTTTAKASGGGGGGGGGAAAMQTAALLPVLYGLLLARPAEHFLGGHA